MESKESVRLFEQKGWYVPSYRKNAILVDKYVDLSGGIVMFHCIEGEYGKCDEWCRCECCRVEDIVLFETKEKAEQAEKNNESFKKASREAEKAKFKEQLEALINNSEVCDYEVCLGVIDEMFPDDSMKHLCEWEYGSLKTAMELKKILKTKTIRGHFRGEGSVSIPLSCVEKASMKNDEVTVTVVSGEKYSFGKSVDEYKFNALVECFNLR